MPSIDFIMNGIYRSANTYLAFAFREAIMLNHPNNSFYEFSKIFDVHNHAHNPALLKLKNDETTIQFVSFRNPHDLIPSLVLFEIYLDNTKIPSESDLLLSIESSVKNYQKFIDYQLEYDNAKILLFDDIINNIHSILSLMLLSVGLNYSNQIDIEKVKNHIYEIDRRRYPDEDNFNKNCHLPRESSNKELSDLIYKLFIESSFYESICKDYDQIEKRARKSPLN